jgi:SEC-C motif-containing protein
MKNCPCFSGKSYGECCKPFHDGRLPDTALQLMRSRYAAYALNLPDYIIKTTHPENAQVEKDVVKWAKGISEFSKGTQFVGLEITDFAEEGDDATVTFVARLLQNGRDVSFGEKSFFKRINGRWFYLSGEIS